MARKGLKPKNIAPHKLILNCILNFFKHCVKDKFLELFLLKKVTSKLIRTRKVIFSCRYLHGGENVKVRKKRTQNRIRRPKIFDW